MYIGADIFVLDMDLLDTRKFKKGMEELISNIVLELLSYMAEKEREKINKDIKKARQNGIHLGRPKLEIDNFEYYYDQVYNKEQMTDVEAMEELEVSKSTFHRRKSEYENN